MAGGLCGLSAFEGCGIPFPYVTYFGSSEYKAIFQFDPVAEEWVTRPEQWELWGRFQFGAIVWNHPDACK